MNARVRDAQYAVRGKIVIRAGEYDADIRAGRGDKLPFDKLIYCNIGNPQSLGQSPITFPRQVLSLLSYPPLMESEDAAALFAPDAIERARRYQAAIGTGGTGAYSHSQGVLAIREDVASFIRDRDGYECDPRALFLTDGASPAVKMMVQSLIATPKTDGLMIPIPQYPLYTATLTLVDGTAIGYLLDEEAGWGTAVAELERSHAVAVASGVNPRGLVVINPGNPTGGCMPAETVKAVTQFAADKGLVLLADEVYQENVWRDGASFLSFKKAACELGLLDAAAPNKASSSGFQLASMHSVSKGFLGECGRRGGYMELCGFDEAVRDQLYKLASISLCSNLDGQVMVGLMCRPPQDGDASYSTYVSERDGILESLKRRAAKLSAVFNKLDGCSCAAPDGALYVFPRVRLPEKALTAAAAGGEAADAMYCMELLDATGIVVVPGSGFLQAEGTFHFRTTILPSESEIDEVIARFTAFHNDFMARYA
jgi:alanine transaminase